jgi:hypothetical protein
VPEPVAEQANYDLIHLGVRFDDGAEWTFVRPLQGGDIKLLPGLVRFRPKPENGQNLSAKHSAKSSLSKFLLAKLGAANARVRTDAKGKTRDLSFRDLSRHVLINETKIQSVESPIQFGQVIDRTTELSTFKYLLTGVDDSALDVTKASPDAATRRAAQVELIDRMLREVSREIEERIEDAEELRQSESAIERQLEMQFNLQESTEVTYRSLSEDRRKLRARREGLTDRTTEIRLLLSRFDLLLQHHESDR